MSVVKTKKLLKIGNSYAVILPKEFVQNDKEIVIEYSSNELHIRHKVPQETLLKETELFGQYGSGKYDLSKNKKKYLKKYLYEKHRPH